MNTIQINGIGCTGEMHKEQNVQVICEDEMFDGIYPDGFNNWQEAIRHLELYYPDIVELTAI